MKFWCIEKKYILRKLDPERTQLDVNLRKFGSYIQIKHTQKKPCKVNMPESEEDFQKAPKQAKPPFN